MTTVGATPRSSFLGSLKCELDRAETPVTLQGVHPSRRATVWFADSFGFLGPLSTLPVRHRCLGSMGSLSPLFFRLHGSSESYTRVECFPADMNLKAFVSAYVEVDTTAPFSFWKYRFSATEVSSVLSWNIDTRVVRAFFFGLVLLVLQWLGPSGARPQVPYHPPLRLIAGLSQGMSHVPL